MILLISTYWTQIAAKGATFKFHCDSINIFSANEIPRMRNKFKFHCDSINMMASITFLEVHANLNSTVILLI